MRRSTFIKLSATSNKPLNSVLIFMACHRTPVKKASKRSDQCPLIHVQFKKVLTMKQPTV